MAQPYTTVAPCIVQFCVPFELLHSALFTFCIFAVLRNCVLRYSALMRFVLFAVGVIALFAFLMCFALLRKVFCVIAQIVSRYCAKRIKTQKMQITQSL